MILPVRNSHFLIINDAAAAQLRLTDGEVASSSPYLAQRRETGLELLRALGGCACCNEQQERGEDFHAR